MYAGSNPTALQSQQWLAQSMTALMAERPYSRITVRDLCQRAGLSRQTFYNFFPDKEAVLRFCLKQTYREQFTALASRKELPLPDLLEAFFSVVTQNRPLIDAILRDALYGILYDEILACVSAFAQRFISREKKTQLLPYSEAMLSGALAQLVVLWIRDEAPPSIEQLSSLLTAFFSGTLYGMNDNRS